MSALFVLLAFSFTYFSIPRGTLRIFLVESTPETFSKPNLLAFNEDLANEMGICLDEYSTDELAQIFSGQKKLAGSHFISMVYAAHQFGNFGPRLGDGRAMLLGEVVDPQGKRFDVQLSMYSKRVVVDALYQKYKGFHVKNPGDFTNWDSTAILPQLPDMENYSLGASAYYILNYKKFSYRAAYVRNEIQNKWDHFAYLLLSRHRRKHCLRW